MKANAVWVGLAIAVSTSAGCAYETVYERGDEYAAPAQESGPPVASYGVPQKDPKGSVNVISLGAEQLPVAGGQSGTFLHVRIAAENRSDDVPWSLNPNDQTLTSASGGASASFAESSAGGPVVTLAKGQHGYLDVYYPAPPASGPITLAWKVHRGDEVVPGSTALDRVSTPDPNYALYEPVYGPNVYMGLGLGWWWWPDYYLWWGRPFGWYYPHYWGLHGYWGPRYYGGYGGYGGRYYGGGRYTGGNWRGGGGGYHGAPSGGGTYHSAPSGGGHGGGGGWRGGGRR